MGQTLEIVFWGVRGSIPVSRSDALGYGGSTSCVEVIADNGQRIVFDGGSGIHPLGNQYMKEGFPQDLSIFITHAHWDHIQGLPFFVPAFVSGNRMTFYGCNQGTTLFEDVLKSQMETPYFPVKLSSWMADIRIESIGESVVDLNGMKIESSYAEHPGMTLGFRLDYKGKRIVYFPDNELFAKFDMEKVFVERDMNDEDLDMETVFLEDQKRKFFSFIGGADVLIHDAQYMPEEYGSKIGWGHSHFEMTVRAAIYGKVKHLVLFHHDPSRSDTDIENIVKISRRIALELGSSMEITAASQNDPRLVLA
ncbi:MAG: MBL fold metallo-hydrolase [Proteobacteria bacterium]|nr:MBL fold metallo-hydrolase [Pseudomonadota bacterium]MBU4471820.1 MBL fold metallo-hydrolase [Pseudomonadota bacterium]MCG2750601.1 MBL fold metallo-hydrolase [Desulfobacteraceae bacterium]